MEIFLSKSISFLDISSSGWRRGTDFEGQRFSEEIRPDEAQQTSREATKQFQGPLGWQKLPCALSNSVRSFPSGVRRALQEQGLTATVLIPRGKSGRFPFDQKFRFEFPEIFNIRNYLERGIRKFSRISGRKHSNFLP